MIITVTDTKGGDIRAQRAESQKNEDTAITRAPDMTLLQSKRVKKVS